MTIVHDCRNKGNIVICPKQAHLCRLDMYFFYSNITQVYLNLCRTSFAYVLKAHWLTLRCVTFIGKIRSRQIHYCQFQDILFSMNKCRGHIWNYILFNQKQLYQIKHSGSQTKHSGAQIKLQLYRG